MLPRAVMILLIDDWLLISVFFGFQIPPEPPNMNPENVVFLPNFGTTIWSPHESMHFDAFFLWILLWSIKRRHIQYEKVQQ